MVFKKKNLKKKKRRARLAKHDFRCLPCLPLGHLRAISLFFFDLLSSRLYSTPSVPIHALSFSLSSITSFFPLPHPDLRTGPSIVVRGWCVRQRSVYVCSALIWT